MKKILLRAMGVTLACSMLSGCTYADEKEKKVDELKIGVSIYTGYDAFIAELMEAMNEQAEILGEKYGITITLDIQNAGNNQATQNDQMDTFIDKGYDIVCINLVDRTDASTIIERGKNNGVPIIFFNRELVEDDLKRWEQLYYVGADAFESGIIQGELLLECLERDFASVDKNGDGILQYVMLEGEASHQDSIVRTMYTINTVTDAGYEVEKLADEIANWNRDQGKTKMVQWLKEFGNSIEVVFSNNDGMALGAIDALKEAGYYDAENLQAPVVFGIDGIQAALETVEDGYMQGTVMNDSDGQAEGMLELAYSIVSGTELDSKFTLVDGNYIRLPYRKGIKE